MKPLNVLSCFDGISCGRVALQRAGIPVNRYWSFEIDKYAIKISQKNSPGDVIALGDIKGWRFFNQLPQIDLLMAGFPCQSHSIAGRRGGIESESGSLLYDLLDVIEFYKPKDLLLENVKGFLSSDKGKAHEYLLDRLNSMGYDIHWDVVNSALVSAQNRERVYWTTWEFEQPEDKGILLKDILEDSNSEYVKVSKRGQFKKFQSKSSTLTGGAHSGGNHSDMDLIGIRKSSCIQIGEALGINGHELLKRVYSKYGKSPTVSTITGGNQFSKIAVDDFMWRRLTPLECERLQTLPDNYTGGISNSQRFKSVGNGWNIDTIVHLLNSYKEKKNEHLS
jgi:DNA-cytosine methyltransferase